MERCLQLSPSPSFCTRKSGLTSSCRATLMARGSLSSEHLPFFWQPHLRLDADDLLAEAPSLRRNCEDLDWKSQASHLRALASRSVPHQSLGAFSNESLIQEKDQTNNVNKADGSNETWFTAGVALIAAALFHCGLILSAVAEEASDKTEAAEAASRVPGWLTPTLLAFPVVSYAIFNVYRSQVNPYAKVSDWMFGVVAVVIVANIVLMFTIGVRLY